MLEVTVSGDILVVCLGFESMENSVKVLKVFGF